MAVSRIIVLDQLAQEGLDLLDAHPQIEYEVRLKLAGAELKQALTEFDGAICRSGVKLMADVLEGNRRLRPSCGPAWAPTTSIPGPPSGRGSWS